MAKPKKRAFLEAIEAIESITGLHVCVNPKGSLLRTGKGGHLDWRHRSHRGPFCEVVKANKKMKSCGGHDSVHLVAEASRKKRPFVSICHAGIAEVVVPVFCRGEHVATIFCGQAITEKVAAKGFKEVLRRVEDLGVDLGALEKVFAGLPHVPEKRMQQIGEIVSLAATQLLESMSNELLEKEALLRKHPRMHKALEYIEENCCDIVREEDVADLCDLSKDYFSRLFKQLTGITFSRYLTELRIRRAQDLLIDTTLTVMEIAARVGYSRHSYFARRFKEVVGVAPLAFRQQVHKEASVEKP